MRKCLIFFAGIAPAVAMAQHVSSVYNRDTHEPFKLERVSVESTVVGPLVRTSTWLTYKNPYKDLTEATLNFDMPNTGALGGFAYKYGDEYVRGRLMDKEKAWFIYTAITSRNLDPGIMDQWTPTDYHCQIFPIKKGSDLRVRLWTVGMLEPFGEKLAVPKPKVPIAVSAYKSSDATVAKPIWTVRAVNSGAVTADGSKYSLEMPSPVSAIAQRFKDGRVYVAGLIHTPIGSASEAHSVHISHATYGAVPGHNSEVDVTAKVTALVKRNVFSFQASTAMLGDPAPNRPKCLTINYVLDGQKRTLYVSENDEAKLIEGQTELIPPTFFRINQPKTVMLDSKTLAFSGWVPKNRQIAARFQGVRYSFRPQTMPQGNDTARIWAQQMLAHDSWMRVKDVLSFSLKYGVPSSATALLAVPNDEMKLFRDKEKLYQKQLADRRRIDLNISRQGRNWSGHRNQNWNSSSGGDPEIRVKIPGARTVEAILPDRRVIDLKPNGDVWGGNFEIPAEAIEGTYRVRILAHMNDGSTVERSWNYQVDRTPPTGRAEFVVNGGSHILEVKSEPGLAEVAAYATDGSRWVLHEEMPGVYRVVIPMGLYGKLTILLKDHAGNRGQILCSPPL